MTAAFCIILKCFHLQNDFNEENYNNVLNLNTKCSETECWAENCILIEKECKDECCYSENFYKLWKLKENEQNEKNVVQRVINVLLNL